MIPGAMKYRRSTLGLGDERVDWNDPSAPRQSGTMPRFEGDFWYDLAQRAWSQEYERLLEGGSIGADEAIKKSADTAYSRMLAAQAWHRTKTRSGGGVWGPNTTPIANDRRIIEDIALGGPASSSLLNAFRMFSRPPSYDLPTSPGNVIQVTNAPQEVISGSELNRPVDTQIDLEGEPGNILDEIKKWLQIVGLILGGVVALYVVDKVLPVND